MFPLLKFKTNHFSFILFSQYKVCVHNIKKGINAFSGLTIRVQCGSSCFLDRFFKKGKDKAFGLEKTKCVSGQRSGRRKKPAAKSARAPSAEPGSGSGLAALWAEISRDLPVGVPWWFLGAGRRTRKDFSEKGRSGMETPQ